MDKSSSFSASSPAFNVVITFFFSHSSRCVVIPHCGFNLHSPKVNDVVHIFFCLFAIYPFGRDVYFAIFIEFLFVLLLVCQLYVGKSFLPVYTLSLYPFHRLFCRTKASSSDEIQFITFSKTVLSGMISIVRYYNFFL